MLEKMSRRKRKHLLLCPKISVVSRFKIYFKISVVFIFQYNFIYISLLLHPFSFRVHFLYFYFFLIHMPNS